LRALAVTSAARLDLLSSVPAMSEYLPGYEGSGWQGLGAQKNTPPEIISALNKQINSRTTIGSGRVITLWSSFAICRADCR
jgi:tripartite-type tricarboxylate transporter receptor subunit TctC